MYSDYTKARELAKKWGLDIHMEAEDPKGDIMFFIKSNLFSSKDLEKIIEWINEEFEEK